MDNPGLSLFQEAGINIESAQNLEEEEDLEEQKRRQEELQNLLTNALDDFKYDDSTMNSSANASMISNQNFKDVPLDDQLKVLYDVRVREINSLRQEFNQYKDEKEKEVNSYKHKLLLYEAEVRHLQTSLQNADSLIEEKITSIRKLEEVIHGKDELLNQLKKENEQNQMEIGAYKMTVEELQLKLNNTNPLYLGTKRFQSEELQKAHQEQIAKLEESLQQQTRKAEYLENERKQLQEEFDKVHNNSKQMETDNSNAIAYFSTSLNNAQQQCHELLDVVEALTKENELIRQRLKSAESDTPFKVIDLHSKHVDYDTLSQHFEKLRQMLLEKDTELSTLKTKLRFYERDMRELLEYRNIKNNITNYDFNACGDMSNKHQVLILQNELKNSVKLLKEKDNHITSLQLVNKELQEKIEEMLEETRNQIKNISHKYSLPQLEKMSADLSAAQNKISELEEKLTTSENKEKELLQLNSNLDEMYKFSKTELENVQAELLSVRKVYENDKQHLERTLKDLQNADEEVKRLQKILTEFKHVETDLKEQNIKLENELEDTKSKLTEVETNWKALNGIVNENKGLQSECEELKQRVKILSKELDQIRQFPDSDDCINKDSAIEKLTEELAEAKNKIVNLEETTQELLNTKTIVEGEKSDLEYQLRECQEKLHVMQSENALSKNVASHDQFIEADALQQAYQIMQDKMTVLEEHINMLQEELVKREAIIDSCNKDKHKLEAELEDVKKEVTNAKQKIGKLQEDCAKLNKESSTKVSEPEISGLPSEDKEERNIEKQETLLLQHDLFKRLLQTELLKHELKVQDNIQSEYVKKIDSIEAQYRQIVSESDKRYKNEIEELKRKESNYRLQFGQILSECGEKISEMEENNIELANRLTCAEKDFDNYKLRKSQESDKLIQLLQKVRRDAEHTIASWKEWSHSVLSGCAHMERASQRSRGKIFHTIESGNAKYAAAQKDYDEKLRKLKKSYLK